MKTILICPNQANGLTVLADSRPLATLPVLGEAFICYWMQHLAGEGFKEVRILTADAVDEIADYTGDGSRWGLKVEIFHELRDLKPEEARKRYKPDYESDWAPAPHDVIEANHLPGRPEEPLFGSHADWFQALQLWLPIVTQTKRIGLREIAPGVWAGRRTKLSRTAKLIGPCWIGDCVQVGKNAVVGPNSFLEHSVVVDAGCSVQNSWVGPETFLGTLTEVKDSLAWGNLLINWRTGSYITVPDSFLMASLAEGKEREPKPVAARAAALEQSPLTRGIGSVMSLAQKLQS